MFSQIRHFKNYKKHYGSLFKKNIQRDIKGLLKKLNAKRAVNIMRMLYEWKRGIAVIKSRPWLIHLESSALCNLKCPCCSNPHRVFKKGEVKVMSLDTFKTIFKTVSPHAYVVKFHIDGEPIDLGDELKFEVIPKSISIIC